MIQFNLLPDVKIAYIKAQRTKRMVSVIALLSSGAALFVLVSLFLLINVVQKNHLNDLSEDIKTDSKKLQSIQDIGKILTIQNQLVSLDKVHDAKPVASRVTKYIETVTPANISIAQLEVMFVDGTMEISGKADKLVDVNKFVDTIKFTKYTTAEDVETQKDAFSNVVLDGFTKDDKGVTYTIKLSFNPEIFDGKLDISLSVPTITTNRSATEKPSALFQNTPIPESTETEN